MISLTRVFRAIESDEFMIQCFLGGDSLTQIRDAILSRPETTLVRSVLRKHPEFQTKLLARINDLAAAQPEGDLRHPYDIAIAAYLETLRMAHSTLFPIARMKSAGLSTSFFARRIACVGDLTGGSLTRVSVIQESKLRDVVGFTAVGTWRSESPPIDAIRGHVPLLATYEVRHNQPYSFAFVVSAFPMVDNGFVVITEANTSANEVVVA